MPRTPHHRATPVGRSRLLLAMLLAGACAKANVRPMPPLPDLSGIRTYNAPGSTDTLPGSADSTLDSPPTMLAAGPLAYPPNAQARGLQGWVVLDFIVGIDGGVEPGSQRLVALSDSVFLPAAMQSMAASRFSPGMHHGAPVRVLVRQEIFFQLTSPDQITIQNPSP